MTHMPGRFAVPIIVPLALLSGLPFGTRASTSEPKPGVSRRMLPGLSVLLALAVVGAVLNSRTLAGLLDEHARFWARITGQTASPLPGLVGRTDVFVEADPLNSRLPKDAFVWRVGRADVFYTQRRMHYTVVFSRDPWLEYAANAAPEACVAWLRERGVTHVEFSWNEVERLARTYGFAKIVTRRWARELVRAGLRPVDEPAGAPGAATSEIYEVTPE
jgi:hypothetical protein